MQKLLCENFRQIGTVGFALAHPASTPLLIDKPAALKQFALKRTHWSSSSDLEAARFETNTGFNNTAPHVSLEWLLTIHKGVRNGGGLKKPWAWYFTKLSYLREGDCFRLLFAC